MKILKLYSFIILQGHIQHHKKILTVRLKNHSIKKFPLFSDTPYIPYYETIIFIYLNYKL